MAIDVVAEEIASNLEEVAEATRALNATGLGYLGGGIVIGAVAGFFVGYKICRKKIYAEAFAASEEEVEGIRETYRQRMLVLNDKPAVEDIIKEKGYDTHVVISEVPNATPPRALRPPVVVSEPINYGRHEAPPIDESATEETEDILVASAVVEERRPPWDYKREMASRTPNAPYVIHQDEYEGSEHPYIQVEYTYYALDDVLVGEDERPVPNPDLVVGKENLKFGHGSNNPNTVYIRNDVLELEIAIGRMTQSYDEEVVGQDGSTST